MASPRVINEASPEDVAKVLRDVYPSPMDLEKACRGSLYEFLEAHVEVIIRLLGVTKRPLNTVLQQGIKLAYEDVPVGCGTAWAALVVAVVSHGRQTKKSTRSGAKLGPQMFRVVKALQEAPSPIMPLSPPAPLTPTKPTRRLSKKISLVEVRSSDDEGASAKSDVYATVLATYMQSDSATARASTDAAPTPARPVLALAAPPLSQKDTPHEYIDSCKRALVRLSAEGSVEEAEMQAGPRGFCLARFPGEAEAKETEMPNLLLEEAEAVPKLKRSASGSEGEVRPCMKRPARMQKRPASTSEAPQAAEPEAACTGGRVYLAMFYRKTSKMALRRCFGENGQAFQFGGHHLTRAAMQAIADHCIGKLACGEWDEAQAHAYAVA